MTFRKKKNNLESWPQGMKKKRPFELKSADVINELQKTFMLGQKNDRSE